MRKNKKQKKELTIDRATWEQLRNRDLKADIMKRHLEYQAKYRDIFELFVSR